MVCAFTSLMRTESGMFVLYAVYVRVSCFVVRGCAVSRRYVVVVLPRHMEGMG